MVVGGTISFQANDRKDVFHVAEARENGIETPDEELLGIESAQFENDLQWVTGRIPKMTPVHIDGDTAIIHAWFRAEDFTRNFRITVYVEYEEAEELVKVESDEETTTERNVCEIEPNEINL